MSKVLYIIAFVMAALTMTAPAVQAQCSAAATVSTRGCPVYTPQGDLVTKGTQQQALRYAVTVCYPTFDWESQKERPGQQPWYVSRNVAGQQGVLRSIPDYQRYVDMKDAKLLRTQCYRQYYQPGWVIMAVTQCREEGFYTFLTTKVLTAADNGATVMFNDRPDLRRFKYPVR